MLLPRGSSIVLEVCDKGTSYSPMLFIIVMEILSTMISTTMKGVSGFCMGLMNGDKLSIPHILFADETFIF